jgi:Fic family protein
VHIPPLEYVQKPLSHRYPVGYHRDFLENYTPNKTFFLNQRLRDELRFVGQTSGDTIIAETYSARLYERLMVDLSWASSNLEGNTYSLLETERLLQENTAVEGKSATETQMILNHKEAIKFIIQNRHTLDLSALAIRNVHALLSDGLLKDAKGSGSLRKIPVGIEGSAYIPMNVSHLIEEHFLLFVDKAKQITDPFEQSLFCLIFIPYLQPFEDLNKRTSRVISNLPFIKNELCPLSFLDVHRTEYIQALLSIYELNNSRPMTDIFINSYKQTALKYKLTKESLQVPHPFKIKYRQFIQSAIAEIIRGHLKGVNEVSMTEIPEGDRSWLTELLQQELSSLNEGNFARFQITPSEFFGWQTRKKVPGLEELSQSGTKSFNLLNAKKK